MSIILCDSVFKYVIRPVTATGIERFAYAVAFAQIVLSAAFTVAPSDLRVAPVLAWIASK
jgi:hypothetical protein